MPIGAAASGVGSLLAGGAGVASAIGASSAAKKQKSNLADLVKQASGNAEAIFGSKPEFESVDYTPLYESDPGYRGIVADILSGDQANLPAAAQLSGDINKAISKSSLDRIQGWDPSFMGALNTLYSTRNQTLKGRLPYEDALAITSDRTRLANDLGMAGGAGPQIAADLGLKRLDLMTNVGPNLAGSIAQLLNTVDPIQRHSTPENFLLLPSQGVPMAIQENQFSSTFDFQQNLEEAFFNAMPDPAAQGLFNLQAFQAGFGGGNSGGASGILSSLGGALSSLGSLGLGVSRGGNSSAGGGYSWPGNNNIWIDPHNQPFNVGNGGYTPIPRANLAY